MVAIKGAPKKFEAIDAEQRVALAKCGSLYGSQVTDEYLATLEEKVSNWLDQIRHVIEVRERGRHAAEKL